MEVQSFLEMPALGCGSRTEQGWRRKSLQGGSWEQGHWMSCLGLVGAGGVGRGMGESQRESRWVEGRDRHPGGWAAWGTSALRRAGLRL